MSDFFMQKDAVISECGLYRYRLTRQWSDGALMTFVMLNPSTADADVDDPTIRRCMSFARREKAAGICVVNLFAFRATLPSNLAKARDPFGPENSKFVEESVRARGAVCAWGAHDMADDPGRALGRWACYKGIKLFCLGRNKSGAPKHPLYVRGDQPLVPYTAYL